MDEDGLAILALILDDHHDDLSRAPPGAPLEGSLVISDLDEGR